MSAPFVFGVSDFITLGNLAWRVYKSTKEAPDSFQKIHIEVLSLHAVLKEAEETLFTSPLPPAREARLRTIRDGCENVLRDLQDLVGKYGSLSTKAKRMLDGLQWGNEDIIEIRSRVIANVTMLTAFISTSQSRVEQKLDQFMKEVREGKKRGSIISDQSVDSLSANERAVWRTIRKELEDIGLTISAFEANREFIFDWFLQAVESGSFKTDAAMSYRPDRMTSGPTSPRSPASPASPASLLILPPPQTPDPLSNRNSKVEESDLSDDVSKDYWALPPLTENDLSPIDSEATQIPEREAAKLKNETRSSSSMSTLLNSMSLTKKKDSTSNKSYGKPTSPTKERKSSKDAKETKPTKGESSKQGGVSEFFSGGAPWRLPDKKMMDVGLFQACKSGSAKALTALIEKGADVNAVNEEGKSALMEAIFWGHEQTVRWLLKQGASVHHRGGSRMTPIPGLLVTATPIGVAISKRNISIIQVILAAGADVNAQKYPLSVLQEAALMGKPLIVDMLLNAKAKINNYSADYGTALMLALRHGKEDVAKLLVEKGARVKHNLDKPTKDGLTSPIEAAIAAEKFSQVNFLLSEIVVVTTSKEARELLKWAQQRYKKKPPVPLTEEQKQIAGLLVDLVNQLEEEEG